MLGEIEAPDEQAAEATAAVQFRTVTTNSVRERPKKRIGRPPLPDQTRGRDQGGHRRDTSPARHAASLATSASNRERRQSKVHRAMEWPKPSSVRSSATTSKSVRARMHRPSCASYQLGLITTTRFTPTRHSDIVHPVSSSQLTEARDRVRSFGGYNTRSVSYVRSRATCRAARYPKNAREHGSQTRLPWI